MGGECYLSSVCVHVVHVFVDQFWSAESFLSSSVYKLISTPSVFMWVAHFQCIYTKTVHWHCFWSGLFPSIFVIFYCIRIINSKRFIPKLIIFFFFFFFWYLIMMMVEEEYAVSSSLAVIFNMIWYFWAIKIQSNIKWCCKLAVCHLKKFRGISMEVTKYLSVGQLFALPWHIMAQHDMVFLVVIFFLSIFITVLNKHS